MRILSAVMASFFTIVLGAAALGAIDNGWWSDEARALYIGFGLAVGLAWLDRALNGN